MTVHDWTELDRVRLAEVLPGAVVVLSTGAVEQHGPHLPTGTDALISQWVTRAATDAAAAQGVEVVLAPPLWCGASDHHLRFGGTISLRAETLLAVLTDVLSSIAGAGARRVLLVNGHGGNSGVCHAAAAAASAHHDLEVAHVDYWSLLDPVPTETAAPAGLNVPGHAGAFETALVRAVRPDLVGEITDRVEPVLDLPTGIAVHSPHVWAAVDGWTDDPSRGSAELGRETLAVVTRALAAALVDWRQP